MNPSSLTWKPSLRQPRAGVAVAAKRGTLHRMRAVYPLGKPKSRAS